MPFVLDVSVAACWVFADEDDTRARHAFGRLPADTAVVPSLWWFEIRNVLIVGERRGRLAEAATATFLRALSRLPIAVDRAPESDATLTLARRHALTVYDAAYLELAQRQSLPLATLDAALERAARSEGVPLLDDEGT